MTLTPGTRLGPYEILSPLGAGGMGEVYTARDTRHNRTVAIKVLPASVASDPDLRARFEREARAIAALDHPHICALYDVGRDNDIDFLVMPLLDGETMAARLIKGPLPIDQVLRYAIEIADALDKAHCQGIVHRDLKPGNVMLTKAGSKLLDFGLAKLRGPAAPIGMSGLTALATAGPATAQGTLIGTVNYMAPEQVEGKEADARSDVFAFGALVYEMATGRRAFDGTSAASVIGAVLKDEPAPIATLQPTTPAALDRGIRTCLAKDPDERWQSAGDLKRELRWIAEAGSRDLAPASSVAVRSPMTKVWAASAIVFALALAGTLPFAVSRLRENPPAPSVVRFSVYPPPGATFAAGNASVPATQFALSPDGRQLAFIASAAGRQQSLWVRALDTPDAKPMAGTDDASYPFWSPDSRMVAFFARGKLLKVDVAGGAPQKICDAGSGRGGAWNRDGLILFSNSNANGMNLVPASGGTPTLVLPFNQDRQETTHRFPDFLPDGRRFLFFVRTRQPENRGIYVGSLDSPAHTRLLTTNLRGLYDPSGFVLFARDGTLMTQAVDPRSLGLIGEPVQIAPQVGGASTDYASFSVSGNRVLAYASSNPQVGQLTWYDRTGRPDGTVGAAGDYVDVGISPDQKRIVFSLVDPQTNTQDIWLTELARGANTRLTFDPATDGAPIWSPDGARIVFRSDRGGLNNLYLKSAGGTGADEPSVIGPTAVLVTTDWSPDGANIVYHSAGATTGDDIWVLPMSGDRKPHVFLQTPFNEMQGKLSPDGHWMAYTSDESGMLEVYVRPFPAGAEKWAVSTNGGSEPKWRGDGKELFYLGADRKLMSVPIAAGGTLEAGVPKALFETKVGSINPEYRNQYAVSKDGNRFLINAVSAGASSPPITVVLNWTAGLKK